MGCQFFRCQWQGLSLIGRDIGPHEKTGGADNFCPRHEDGAASRFQFIFHVHDEVELSRGEDISAHRSRGRAVDLSNLSL